MVNEIYLMETTKCFVPMLTIELYIPETLAKTPQVTMWDAWGGLYSQRLRAIPLGELKLRDLFVDDNLRLSTRASETHRLLTVYIAYDDSFDYIKRLAVQKKFQHVSWQLKSFEDSLLDQPLLTKSR